MPTPVAIVNPDLLSWARERAQMSAAALAKKLGVREEKLDAWEIGDARPTFRQAQKLAKATHIPFGYLFLQAPPKETLAIPDLRTIGSEPLDKPSAELIEVVRQVLFRQAWYQGYQRSHEETRNPLAGRSSLDTPILDIVADIREVLGLPVTPVKGTWEEYFRNLVSSIEANGVLVMRSGIVGNNTHRPLSVREFRGFAICDPVAPVIFINLADAPAARLFTLIHELAHIWLGVSGVSDAKPDSHRKEERICNAVAAEFLVPNEAFLSRWDTALENWRDNLALIAAEFHVSQWVIARKALDNKLISFSDYRSYTREKYDKYKNKKGGGGDFYKGLKGKVSERFSIAVLGEALSGRVLLRDAGRLLSIQPNKIEHYAKELGV